MTTETKPTVTLFLTLEEAKALENLLLDNPALWKQWSFYSKVSTPYRFPVALRQAIKEAK